MIVDAHNDLLLELVLSREEGKFGDLVLRTGDERLFDRYWLPRLEAGGVGVQVCPLYGACAEVRAPARARPGPGGRAPPGPPGERRPGLRGPHQADLDDPRLGLVLSMEGVEGRSRAIPARSRSGGSAASARRA